MNPHRIKAILADEDFVGMVSKVRADLTKEVMSKRTGDERRSEALAEYHALDSLLAKLRSTAHDAKQE